MAVNLMAVNLMAVNLMAVNLMAVKIMTITKVQIFLEFYESLYTTAARLML
jgi:hypothetical protein